MTKVVEMRVFIYKTLVNTQLEYTASNLSLGSTFSKIWPKIRELNYMELSPGSHGALAAGIYLKYGVVGTGQPVTAGGQTECVER